jgi:hypothetical protein
MSRSSLFSVSDSDLEDMLVGASNTCEESHSLIHGFLEGDNFSDPGKIFDLLVPHISSSPSAITGGDAMTSDEHQRCWPAERAGKDGRLSLDGPLVGIRPAWRTIPSGARPPLRLGTIFGYQSNLAQRYWTPLRNTWILSETGQTKLCFSDVLVRVPEGCLLFLNSLLEELAGILRPHIPLSTYNLLFPSGSYQSRQAILNRYEPGEGITPHVDLLKRFGDGIIGVSLGAGCVMDFQRGRG